MLLEEEFKNCLMKVLETMSEVFGKVFNHSVEGGSKSLVSVHNAIG